MVALKRRTLRGGFIETDKHKKRAVRWVLAVATARTNWKKASVAGAN